VSAPGGLLVVVAAVATGVRLEGDLGKLAPFVPRRGPAGARFWVEVYAVVVVALFAAVLGLVWGHTSAGSLFPR
jgi:hypothetical protein